MDLDQNSPEVVTALQAAVEASALCEKIRMDLAAGGTLLKSDRSPVTIADFGSQAVICKMIRQKFPHDAIVAEEDSKELRRPDRSGILERVTDYVNAFIPHSSSEEVCSWIDLGSNSVTDRFWALDPIDGTKGFLRGDQYAIALALIEKGRVTLGILACPNLYADIHHLTGEKGCLFFALKGKGAFQMDRRGLGKRPIFVSKAKIPSEAIITESVEPDHADHLTHQRLAEKLKISKPSLRMDSQAKYGILARGEVTLYLRVPSSAEPGYKENIWDHAAGSIIAEEAGGKVTDVLGHPLDFSSGIKMEKNQGIFVSNGMLHEVVLKALEM
ncbi:MAG TPA: 3'(2'),5'-bisphosphate nucleotidase [Thermodesulfobacteriota bacterium]|nr:3'(2'),5'-bisphosphate nucleotidase [Thermodesulfobacteriota bacterium]